MRDAVRSFTGAVPLIQHGFKKPVLGAIIFFQPLQLWFFDPLFGLVEYIVMAIMPQ